MPSSAPRKRGHHFLFWDWGYVMSFGTAQIMYSGRKHTMLWLSGFGYIIIGVTWIITGIYGSPDPAFDWLRPYIGVWAEPEVLGWLWVFAGFVQTLPIVLPKARHATVNRPMAFGFGAAILAPAVWAAIYMLSGAHGYIYGPRHGVVFLIMSAIAWEISGWDEPSATAHVSKIVEYIKEEANAD